jgi:hypothetical protein
MKRVLGVATLIAALSACGDGSSSSSPTPTTPSPGQTTGVFQGTIAGNGGQTGTLSVTIQAQVSGTVRVAGGGTTALTGTHDSSTNAVNLSGGGFTLAGRIDREVLAGRYSSPNNSVGAFSSLNANNATVTTFCGTYEEAAGESGIYNVQVSTNGTASGDGVSTTTLHGGFLLTGQLTGTTLNMTQVDIDTGHAIGTHSMTVQGGTVSGTCGSGCTVSASTSRCQ